MGESNDTGSPDELLIFDFGQVIVRLDWQSAFAEWETSSGVGRDVLAASLQSDDVFLGYETGQLPDTQFIRHACDKLGLAIDDAAFIQGWNAIFKESFASTMSAIAAVNRLEGRRRIVVLSNTNAIHERYLRSAYRRELTHFDALYFSHKMNMRKPDDACFNAVLEAEGVDATRCLFFDDSPANVVAANRLGIQATLVTKPDDVIAVLDAYV